jgi:hypothetical protein
MTPEQQIEAAGPYHGAPRRTFEPARRNRVTDYRLKCVVCGVVTVMEPSSSLLRWEIEPLSYLDGDTIAQPARGHTDDTICTGCLLMKIASWAVRPE